MRVVTAARDVPKVAMLVEAGMSVSERWWVKALDTDPPGGAYEGTISGDGFSGILSAAPPVYDPGGPVVLVTAFSDAEALAAAEEEAVHAGAVLAILPKRRPGLCSMGSRSTPATRSHPSTTSAIPGKGAERAGVAKGVGRYAGRRGGGGGVAQRGGGGQVSRLPPEHHLSDDPRRAVARSSISRPNPPAGSGNML